MALVRILSICPSTIFRLVDESSRYKPKCWSGWFAFHSLGWDSKGKEKPRRRITWFIVRFLLTPQNHRQTKKLTAWFSTILCHPTRTLVLPKNNVPWFLVKKKRETHVSLFSITVLVEKALATCPVSWKPEQQRRSDWALDLQNASQR